MTGESAARVIADDGWRRLAPGTLVAGRFEVLELLGEGGMGAVYVAEDRVIGRKVAVKLLLVPSRQAAARFQTEARAASRVSSRHVAAVHDFGEDPEHGLYMVMELLNGSPLDAVLETQGPLTPSQAAAIGADIAEALGAAHAQGVVHRDLKPANVLVLDEGGLKVLDFGIARVIATDGQRGADVTADGMIIGTPTYMSPEGAKAEEVGPAADLYSLGVILFEMVTGRPPFVDELPAAILTAHVRRPAPPIGSVRPDLPLPEGFADIVDALLEKDPDRRPRSALEVAQTLRPMTEEDGPIRLAGEGMGLGAPTARVATPVRHAPKRGWIPLAIGAAVVLVAVVTGIVMVADDDAPAGPRAEPGQPEVDLAAPANEAPNEGAEALATTIPSGLEAPPSPATIEIAVSTRPARATLRLDGEEVTSPMTVPNDGAEHELTIGARGFVPERRALTADRDHALEIVLRRRPRRGRRDRLPAKMREW